MRFLIADLPESPMARRVDGASPERRPGPARILDVAEVASVSVATVSRVLNGDSRVDQALRERVLAAAAQLGYRPNRLARNLRRQQMDAIGIVVPDIENPHFAATVRIVEAVALGLGHRVLVCNTDEDGDRQAACPQMLAGEGGSGGGVFPAHPGARRLIDAGHTSIVFVGGRSEVDTGSERQRGYLAAIEEAGLTPVLADGRFRRDAAGATRRAGLRFPGDIPISAVDAPPWAELLDPPLTVLAQPIRAMATRAVDFLVRRLSGDQSPAARDVFPLELIVRRSCGTAHLP